MTEDNSADCIREDLMEAVVYYEIREIIPSLVWNGGKTLVRRNCMPQCDPLDPRPTPLQAIGEAWLVQYNSPWGMVDWGAEWED